jgi:hypothetical protein
MSDNLLLLLGGAIINGAVTWGVVSTKLDWMRRDIDALLSRVAQLERRS